MCRRLGSHLLYEIFRRFPFNPTYAFNIKLTLLTTTEEESYEGTLKLF